MTPDVSVIMATYNGEAHLEEQLASIREQVTGRAWEVVIADNGSTDSSLAITRRVTSGMGNVTLVDAREQQGQSYARNEAAAASSGAFLVFVDQDDRLSPDYLERMASALDRAPLVASRMDCDLLNTGWERGARTPAQVRELGDGLGFLKYAAGCTIGIHRKLFELVGGFDTAMIGAAEDVDLCWRAQLAGPCSLQFVPDAVVAYRFRGSLGGIARQAKGHGIAQAQLVRRYEAAGMVRPRLIDAARRQAVSARQVVRLRSRASVAALAWQLVHGFWYAWSVPRRKP